MPRSPQQFDRMRAAARAKILASALAVFKQRGFHAASMEQIARRAKVSKGLAYNYFASKEALLAAVIEHWFAELEGLWNAVAALPRPLEKLQRFLDLFCDSVRRDRDLYRLYLTVFLELDYLAAVQQAAERSPRLTRQVAMIRAASRALFRELGAADPEAEVAFFRLLTSGLVAEYIMAPRDFPLEAIKSRILSYYRSALAPSPPVESQPERRST